jgi:hypothetical protein
MMGNNLALAVMTQIPEAIFRKTVRVANHSTTIRAEFWLLATITFPFVEFSLLRVLVRSFVDYINRIFDTFTIGRVMNENMIGIAILAIILRADFNRT